MDAYQQHKQDILKLMQATASFAQANKRDDIKRRLDEAARHLSLGKLTVVVCGEFKKGKSSLVNALLEEPSLFPVDVDITTSVVSTITYGEREKVTVVTGERGKEKAQVIGRGEIPDYVTEQRNRNNERRVRLLMIESPNERLRNGLLLADTPGIGSLNVQHTDITYAFIPNADAIIFVSDALAPLSEADLKFVEMIARHCDNVIYVVTKIDAVQNYKAVIESNREKLSKVLDVPGERVKIIPVSSTDKLAYLQSQDPEDLEDSNFTALEGELWRLLTERRGNILLTRALTELGRAVAELRGPIQVEWEACQKLTKEELDRLEAQFREARDRHQTLLEKDAEWRTQLRYGLDDIRSNTHRSFQQRFREIQRGAKRYMDDDALLQSPEQIVGLLEVDIDALWAEIGEQISSEAAALHLRIEAATGLDLNPFEVTARAREKAHLAPVQLPGSEEVKKTSWWHRALDFGTILNFKSGAGATLGALLGGVVGFFTGGPIGAGLGIMAGRELGSLAGGATGARQALSQLKEKDRKQIKEKVSEVILPYLEDSRDLCNSGLNKMIVGLDRSMQDELMGRIRQEKKASEQTLSSIKDARRLSEEQAARRADELKVRLRHLEQIQRGMNQVAEIVVSQVRAARRTPKPVVEAEVAAASAQHAAADVSGKAEPAVGVD